MKINEMRDLGRYMDFEVEFANGLYVFTDSVNKLGFHECLTLIEGRKVQYDELREKINRWRVGK